jgi:ATP-dependent Lon protease
MSKWSHFIVTELRYYADFLTSANVQERLIKATRLVVKQNSIISIERKIASDVNENLSKQQKEYYLRQQLAAIQRELHSLQSGQRRSGIEGSEVASPKSELDDDDQQDADDLAELKSKIEAMELGSEERKICVREWRRMKRIQPSSVEHGVIRSYVCVNVSTLANTYMFMSLNGSLPFPGTARLLRWMIV